MSHGLRKAVDHLRACVTPPGLTDAQLLNRFLSERDESAFATLVRRHGAMVLGVCRRILRDAHDSEDAFQATFLVLAQKARSVLNTDALASWLYTVAYRIALEGRKRNARRRQRERVVDVMPHPQMKSEEAADWRPLLDYELNRLPEKLRSAVVLCDLEGRTRKEVARQLGVPEGTLSSRLASARRLLAERLGRRGISLSGGALAVAMSATASAGVPATLVGSTARFAALVAAGQLTMVSSSVVLLMKGALKSMLIAKLKATLTTVLVVATLGVSGLVYCAAGAGQPGQAAKKPASELEALRHENELLKVNLRVTLEKIQSLEKEVVDLKRRTQADVNALKGYSVWLEVKAENRMESANPAIDGALKWLRETQDADARKRALDQIDSALKKLRGQQPQQAK